MAQAMRKVLEAAEDPAHSYWPPDLDWPAACDRVRSLQPTLERLAGRPFVLDDEVQDASFFADLSIQTLGERPNW